MYYKGVATSMHAMHVCNVKNTHNYVKVAILSSENKKWIESTSVWAQNAPKNPKYKKNSGGSLPKPPFKGGKSPSHALFKSHLLSSCTPSTCILKLTKLKYLKYQH